jgi:hypothetical protein
MKISPRGLNEENNIHANGSAMASAPTRRNTCSNSLWWAGRPEPEAPLGVVTARLKVLEKALIRSSRPISSGPQAGGR